MVLKLFAYFPSVLKCRARSCLCSCNGFVVVVPKRSITCTARPFTQDGPQRQTKVASTPLAYRQSQLPFCQAKYASNQYRKVPKRRLDESCFQLYPEFSKSEIRSWIAQGKVTVNEQVIDKAGTPIKNDATVILTAKQEKFVCRAGYKLDAALKHFKVDITGKRVLDSGISTGGFTDCLLQRGASSVIGVDVGYGQVAERVRRDNRVTIMERTNVRHLRLSDLPGSEAVQVVTLDLSFISVLKVVASIRQLMTSDACLVVLIKPQFEAKKSQVEPGGIVRDPDVHRQVVENVVSGIEAEGFTCQGYMTSPVQGAVAGNKEFLAYFTRKTDFAGWQ